MTSHRRQYPVFVYGTLRHGQGNIVGDLITIDPTHYTQVLADLDRLEGYHPARAEDSHYIRTATPVTATNPLPGGGTWETFHTAWIYLAGDGVDPDTMTRVPGDDWLARVSAR
jgi:gamma-glutamylcyclotransferase (GGCT)/AIG2-like uncharacterized protein YtfP